MKFLVVVFALVSTVFALNPAQDEWIKFKSTHNKQYSGAIEESLRFKIFKDNLRKIEEHNEKFTNGLVSYKKGVTKFADMTSEEFQEMLTYNKVNKPMLMERNGTKFVAPTKNEVPSELDWRKHGAVTEVKDQGKCGSCWSFSTTGSIEGQNFLKTNKLESLSEQNLIDCSWNYGDYGCDGGLMHYAYKYILDYGVMTEEEYPYRAVDGVCKYADSDKVIHIKSLVELDIGDEEALLLAVGTIGPVSAGVDAIDFQLYERGIMDSNECGSTIFYLNHGVLVVGYGKSETGEEYWIVKNSWGADWGEDGYIRLTRNKNMCGIASDVSYPVL